MGINNLITVLYACGHKSEPHERLDLGVIDPDPGACECESCWPDDTKDLSSLLEGSECYRKNPKVLWCPSCKESWRKEHGATVDVIQTHSCGHRWIRSMDHLDFLPSEDGKYYSSHPFECLDCHPWAKSDASWLASHLGRGKRYE